jgi:RNA polymerase sigma-70 factor, ECF subfamily
VDEIQRRLRLEHLFYAHAGAVRAYARRRIDVANAEDTVSEVFAIAWRRLDDVPDDALPWLLGCARRVLSHQHRRARRDYALLDRLEAGVTGPAPNDGALASALSKLSDRDREVLLLIAWEGLEPTQAARVLGCSRSALAVRLYRARRRLAAHLHRGGNSKGAGAKPSPAKEVL